MHFTMKLGLVALVAWWAMGAAQAADTPPTFKVGEFTFQRPKGWQSVTPASQMRAAQMKIPGAKDESAEVVFFHFGPGDGGGTQANVDRWLGQFKEPRDQIKAKVEEAKVGAGKITYVQAEGTYSASMAGHASPVIPKAMLLGAILESAEGNVFIKLTGPASLVKSSQEAFRKMSEGALKGK
jgi:hypothetical protein